MPIFGIMRHCSTAVSQTLFGCAKSIQLFRIIDVPIIGLMHHCSSAIKQAVVCCVDNSLQPNTGCLAAYGPRCHFSTTSSQKVFNQPCKFLKLSRQSTLISNVRRLCFYDGSEFSDSDNSDEEDILVGPKEFRGSEEFDLKPGEPHRIFVLQPYVKWGPDKVPLTTPELLLEESISLVRTLRWKIIDKAIYSTTRPRKKQIFGKGTFSTLCERIAETPALTAVFVSLDRLSSVQQKELEDMWNFKVFDRYSLVLEIFKQHARTREAKLQIALAEIPVHRSRLRMKDEQFDQQSGAQRYIGGRGETFLEVRQRVLWDREMKLKRALSKLEKKRGLLRKERESKQFPVVAVVGYTNAGLY